MYNKYYKPRELKLHIYGLSSNRYWNYFLFKINWNRLNNKPCGRFTFQYLGFVIQNMLGLNYFIFGIY